MNKFNWTPEATKEESDLLNDYILYVVKEIKKQPKGKITINTLEKIQNSFSNEKEITKIFIKTGLDFDVNSSIFEELPNHQIIN